MQHQVPQFIEVEDKIFGPLTAKQFFYIAAGVASIFILYVFLQLWLVILLGVPIGGFFIALAFLKLNGVPFIKTLSNAIGFVGQDKLYLWKKTPKAIKPREERLPESDIEGAKLTQNKLSDLSWSLDVQQNIKRKTR